MTYRILVAAIVSVSALSACSSSDLSFGERLQAEGRDTAAAGESWVEGKRMVDRGQKLIKEGREDVRSGESKIERGEDLVEDGRDMMAAAERDYTTTSASN